MSKYSSLPNFSTLFLKIIFEIMLQIHERIRQARVSAGLKPEELAKKIGVPRTTYLYWEDKTPSLKRIKQVEKALNLPEGYLLGENSDNKKLNGEQKIISSLNKLINDVAAVRAEVRAGTEYNVMKDAKNNDQVRVALMMTINKLIGENLEVDEQTGNLTFVGK